MKRVGIIAILHESNTFIDQPTTIEHFRSNLFVTGSLVLDAFRGTPHEVGGFISVLENKPGIELVGILGARAMPFGTIHSECWNEIIAAMMESVSLAGDLDGLLVAPHGATVAENALDADGNWLERVRNHYGPDLPIIGTLDLHANVSQKMVDACTALFGYRTNPHLDQLAVGKKAGVTMLRTLQGEIHPSQYLIQLPMAVNIERQATSEPHGRLLWSEADRLVQGTPGLLELSCLYGFPYADVEEMGSSIIAVAERSREVAIEGACSLANYWWNHRDAFAGHLISVEDAIEQAIIDRQKDLSKPIGLLEMGDNVGGGSPGDGTWIAHAWLAKGAGKLLTVLADPDVVQAAVSCGVGASVRLSVGGKIDPQRHGPPIEDTFRILSMSDGKFHEPEARHGGYSHFDQGTTAVLESDRGLTVIATTRRVAPMSLHQILSQGLSPGQFAGIILKGVHAPVAAYEKVCGHLIRVNTDGVTTADLQRLTFHRRRKPMYPWEKSMSTIAAKDSPTAP